MYKMLRKLNRSRKQWEKIKQEQKAVGAKSDAAISFLYDDW